MLKAKIFLCALFFCLSASAAAQDVDPNAPVDYTVEQYVLANYPVAMAFAPDGRLFYTEKTTGNVRLVGADGVQQPEAVINLPTTANRERGMLGIAIDPDYAENGYIWVFHTVEGNARDYPANQIVRFHEENGVGSDPVVMLSVPITNGETEHNGGNIHFDADGTLYVSFGDYRDDTNAQNLDVIPGKIHHFAIENDQLVPAEGNPFEGSSIYAYGLRNPFDFTFDPISGRIFATENGQNCDDEVNLILAGFSYGWGENYECVGTELMDDPLYVPPLLSFTPTIAPTGIVIYDNPAIPQWRGQLFFCAWVTGELTRAVLNTGRTAIIETHTVDLQGEACRIDVEVSPDGAIYFSSVSEDGGAIYRLVPNE